MIIVDVEVEATGSVYDFKLDENVPIVKIIDEMCELIARKEKCKTSKNPINLIFCKKSTGQVLSHSSTLSKSGIVSGDRLMLI